MLLSSDEPLAVEARERDGRFLVVCEHASNRIPHTLRNLELRSEDLSRHIAWDPGALQVADGIAARLNGTLIAQRYSRLVVDCNRSLELPDAITRFSEDTEIPGNIDIGDEDRTRRIAEIWTPFHNAIDRAVEGRIAANQQTVLVTVHSFTPVYRGTARPWHVGIISTDDRSLADVMLDALRRDSTLVVGDNEPYSSKDNVDYTIRRHGRDRGLPHVMIEIRSDIIANDVDQRVWADRLAAILKKTELGFVEARGAVA